jgi:hypothetical protein
MQSSSQVSDFLDVLSERLTLMEQEVRALPEKLDSIVARIDRRKWDNLLVRINKDYNNLLDELIAPQSNGVLTLPVVFDMDTLSFTQVTGEDKARWRNTRKPEIRVVIGKGKVRVMTFSEIADEEETTASNKTPSLREQGFIILTWDRYQKLVYEIGKLIGGCKEIS